MLTYTDELKFICNKKEDIFRRVKQAPTNLVARMHKLTFKHNLTDFMRLMKDTVLYPFPRRMTSCLKLTEQRLAYRMYS